MANNLIYKTFGARQISAQVSRIDKGFQLLGLTEHNSSIDNTPPNFIYANDPGGYQEALFFRDNFAPQARLIFNVLDIPEHLFPNFDLNQLKESLKKADTVTSISKFVQNQLREFLNIDNTVIYQPLMTVGKDKPKTNILLKKYKVLTIGRVQDPNKRTILAANAFNLLGYKNEEIAYVGTEYPLLGEGLGKAREDYLNEIYQTVDFVVCLGKIEGLNLPVAEAMSCGAIPLIYNDLTTKEELIPKDYFPEYNSVYPDVLSLSNFIATYMQDNDKKTELKEKLYKYYKDNLEEKFAAKNVAEKIVKIYERI